MNTLKQRMYVFFVVGLLLLLTGCTTSENITIVFDTNGGSIVETIITDGKTTLNLPNNPTKEGFTFDGWYFDNETFELTFTNISQINITNGRVTVYAKWIPIETELSLQLRGIYQLATESSSFTGTYEEWLETVRGPQGIPGTNGKNILVRVNGTKFEWQHEGDSIWIELYDLNSLKGTNGKEVAFQVEGGFIQWQYTGDTIWNNLISLATLTGAKGDQGETGIGVKDTYLNDKNELIIVYTDESEINLGQLAIIYTVVFKDYNGYILDVQTLTYGSSATAPIDPTRVGYTFTGWSDTFDNVTVNKEIIAEYTINTYTVTFDTKGGETVELMADVPYGSTIILPTPIRYGYDFVGWYKGDTIHSTHFGEESFITSNTILYARWQRSTFMVQFIDYNETILYSELVTYGTSVNKPANPSRVGHIFTGWDKSFNIVESDLVIMALYNPINYTITFESNSGSNISSITLPYESILPALPTPTKVGHDFMGWYTDELLTTTFDSNTMPLNGAALYAKWELSTYHIIFDTAGGDLITSLPVIYSSQVNQLPSATKTDFIFDGWLFGEDSFTTPFTYLYTNDITLVAKWKGLAEGVEFQTTSTEVTITSYIGADSEIVLPDTIGGLPITTIAPGAFKNNNTITSLTLGSYITTIGNEAFRNMSELTFISMPASAKTIGTQVLYESNKLESMVISSEAAYELRYLFGNNINFVPNSLALIKYANGSTTINKILTQNNMKGIALELANDTTSIVNNQFAYSLYLKHIIIPANVNLIGDQAFENATSLQTVTFEVGSNLKTIGWYAFSNTSSLNNIILPTGVNSIGRGAFYSATSLTQLNIPTGVLSLEQETFRNATSLQNVIFESYNQLQYINNNVFYNTNSLLSIDIPSSVVSIGVSAFAHNSALHTINFGDNSQLISIGSNAFYNTYSLINITIPKSVTNIGYDAFKNNSVLIIYAESLAPLNDWHGNWNPDKRPVIWGYIETIDDGNLRYTISSNHTISLLGLSVNAPNDINLSIPDYINAMEVIQILENAFKDETRLVKISLPNTIQSIQSNTFYNANRLESVEFGEHSQIEKISFNAFYNATSLISISIPASMTNIEYGAFYNTTTLSTVTFEQGSQLTSIGSGAFANATSLTNINIPASVVSIGSGAFSYAVSLQVVTFEEGSQLTSIGSVAFYNATSLTNINIPTNVINIGERAFYNATSLKNIIIPEFITIIERETFSNTTSLTSINIPASVISIESGAFYNSTSLSTVIFEENSQLVSIGSSVFSNTTSLTSINIPASVTNIGSRVFYYSTSLSTITFEEGSQLTFIGEYFLNGTSVRSINIPENMTKIGSYTFWGAHSITSIDIPTSVKTIEFEAFYGNTSLKSIRIPSSVTNIEQYAFHNIQSLTIYTDAISKPAGWDSNWNPSGIPVIWSLVEYGISNDIEYARLSDNTIIIRGISSNSTSSDIVLPSSINGFPVIKIQNFAFSYNNQFTSIFIPNTITTIGWYAFEYYTGIINTSFTSKPTGWDSNWSPFNATVNWGCLEP